MSERAVEFSWERFADEHSGNTAGPIKIAAFGVAVSGILFAKGAFEAGRTGKAVVEHVGKVTVREVFRRIS
jgi:hypothetical protein